MGNKQNEYKIKDWNWTPEAIRCYKRGCVCKGCIITEIMESVCFMKYAVIELVRIKGKPPEQKEIDMDKVIKYLDRGFTLNDIAKILNVSRCELSKETKAFGIKGYFFRNGELSKRGNKNGKK